MLRTRQQEHMELAISHVSDVQTNTKEALQKEYGRICLTFPSLVQTNGLCLTVAFLESKAKGKPSGAHQLVLTQIKEILGLSDLQSALAGAPFGKYMEYTNRVTDAWVFYKRFAVSMLGADPTDDDTMEQPS